MQEKKKVVVTGGAGFIGSHLVDALVKDGLEVHVIDNLSRGKKKNVNPAAHFYEIDIRNFKDIVPVIKKATFVFHVAALPRVAPSIKDPRGTHDVNVTGTLNVLLAARDAQVKRVIYSSSSTPYGDQDSLPLYEEMTPHFKTPYSISKYVGEVLCQLFYSLYGLKTVSFRYFKAALS